MNWQEQLQTAKLKLLRELAASGDSPEEQKRILKSPELKNLFTLLAQTPKEEKAEFGAAINLLKKELEDEILRLAALVQDDKTTSDSIIDITAPFDVNSPEPQVLLAEQGSIHPISQEIAKVSEIFNSMGYEVFESRQLDDAWHMFTSLNFPEDHPARDDYDTFVTEEELIAPAHTSTMQSRILSLRKPDLESGRPIAAIVPDRVFRNEDVDARHEHTFNQVEGIYVTKNVNVGNLIATLRTFLSAYYQKEVETRVNPFYFPFTEPSFEFALSCPFCDKKGCNICSQSGWIELLGCGMIHPNVLEMAGIDSKTYSGFAFGCGIERLIMMKYGIEDVRLFHSAKLKFLKQF